MSVSYIPEWTKLCLWGKAGGRCEYRGCNRALYRDEVTQAEFNSAYIAHIIGDKENGPRGHPVLSKQLRQDIDNLMLLCDAHHRLVDKRDLAGHSVERLREMKRQHEERVERLTLLGEERQSHVLLYGAKIGEHDAPLTLAKASAAMLPERYPASARPIELGLQNSSFVDAEPRFWAMEVEHLRRQFATHVKPRLVASTLSHLSVFGLAPIPLLIELGRLLSDIPAAEVFQLHREPPDWVWQPSPVPFDYEVTVRGVAENKTVALVLALSADIVDDRIERVLGRNVTTWRLTHESPGNDYLKGREQLQAFRGRLREVFNRIKTRHGEDTSLHLFPAVPVSAAVEIGRVWMPKADLPFRVYDQNRTVGGFVPALDISQTS